MIKRLILSVLAITAIPAVIMSFPVWADDDLSITLTGSVLGEVTRFQVYNAVTYSFVSYPGP
ncbi:MAG TPA: hypothetical protein VI522_02985, partial [Gammaproteobacteria bacterium]|nr:hypothetical protein [Gammaproteobacteria bacterium]